MSKITEKGNHYVVKVKRNQKKLFLELKQTIDSYHPVSYYCSQEVSKGRIEKRIFEVYKRQNNLIQGWETINRIIRVRREFLYPNKVYSTASFYITDLQINDAKFLAKGIRSHWHIENKLHYVKDVIMREDKECTKNKKAAANLALLRDRTFNILKDKNKSIKYAIELCAHYSVKKLLKNIMRT